MMFERRVHWHTQLQLLHGRVDVVMVTGKCIQFHVEMKTKASFIYTLRILLIEYKPQNLFVSAFRVESNICIFLHNHPMQPSNGKSPRKYFSSITNEIRTFSFAWIFSHIKNNFFSTWASTDNFYFAIPKTVQRNEEIKKMRNHSLNSSTILPKTILVRH